MKSSRSHPADVLDRVDRSRVEYKHLAATHIVTTTLRQASRDSLVETISFLTVIHTDDRPHSMLMRRAQHARRPDDSLNREINRRQQRVASCFVPRPQSCVDSATIGDRRSNDLPHRRNRLVRRGRGPARTNKPLRHKHHATLTPTRPYCRIASGGIGTSALLVNSAVDAKAEEPVPTHGNRSNPLWLRRPIVAMSDGRDAPPRAFSPRRRGAGRRWMRSAAQAARHRTRPGCGTRA